MLFKKNQILPQEKKFLKCTYTITKHVICTMKSIKCAIHCQVMLTFFQKISAFLYQEWNITTTWRITYDDTYMTFMKIVQFSRHPFPLVHLRSKFVHPLDLRPPWSNKFPLFQIITKKIKENIIQRWLLYVIRSFLQIDFLCVRTW